MKDDIKNFSDKGSEEANGTLNNIPEDEAQVSLDSLLYDNSSEEITKETPEETALYEAFFADYKKTMAKTLASIQSSNEDAVEETVESENESEFLISLPKQKDKKAKSDSKWHEEITLAPEVYEDLSEEAEIFEDDEEIAAPDFDLGQATEKKSDKFQLSFSFNGEEPEQPEAEEEEKEKKYDPEKPRTIDWAFDFVELFVFTLVAVMILTSFMFKHSVVDGDSMMNTLNHGEHLIISDIFYTPQRGDIVVFEDYSTTLDKAVVKRVIGLPGETVKIVMTADGKFNVYIDGELLDEDYAYYDQKFLSYSSGEWTVGENEVFVMGDNRFNSKDSRDSGVGPISVDSILGKVIFRFYPFDKFGTVN